MEFLFDLLGGKSPEEGGPAERRNHALKFVRKKVIKKTNAIGAEAMGVVMTESVCAIAS